ncbi:MAG: hypothetical protein RL585_89, partial [Pseudomonadota bacterium]
MVRGRVGCPVLLIHFHIAALTCLGLVYTN